MRQNVTAAVLVLLILSASCISITLVQASTGLEGLAQVSFSGRAEGQCLVLSGMESFQANDSPAYLGQGSVSIDGNVAATNALIGDTFNVAVGPYTVYMPTGGVVSKGSLFVSWSEQEVNLTFSSNDAQGFFGADAPYADVFIAGTGSVANYDTYTPKPSALSYSGTIKNSSGTFPISGRAVSFASDVRTANNGMIGTVNMYVWVFNEDGSSYKAFVWSPKTWLTPFGSPPMTLSPSTVFQRAVQVGAAIPETFPSWITLTLLTIVSLLSVTLFKQNQKQNRPKNKPTR